MGFEIKYENQEALKQVIGRLQEKDDESTEITLELVASAPNEFHQLVNQCERMDCDKLTPENMLALTKLAEQARNFGILPFARLECRLDRAMPSYDIRQSGLHRKYIVGAIPGGLLWLVSPAAILNMRPLNIKIDHEQGGRAIQMAKELVEQYVPKKYEIDTVVIGLNAHGWTDHYVSGTDYSARIIARKGVLRVEITDPESKPEVERILGDLAQKKAPVVT